MRDTSMYEFTCAACGTSVTTTTTDGVCSCGQAYRLEWQAPYTPKPDPPPSSLENGS